MVHTYFAGRRTSAAYGFADLYARVEIPKDYSDKYSPNTVEIYSFGGSSKDCSEHIPEMTEAIKAHFHKLEGRHISPTELKILQEKGKISVGVWTKQEKEHSMSRQVAERAIQDSKEWDHLFSAAKKAIKEYGYEASTGDLREVLDLYFARGSKGWDDLYTIVTDFLRAKLT